MVLGSISGWILAFVDIGLNAVMISALYALIAIGFTMVFGVGGVLNLAHGALIMAGAYALVILTTDSVLKAIELPFVGIQLLELPTHPALAAVLAVIVVAVLSLLLYLGLVRYIEENPVVTFLATVLVAVLFSEIIIEEVGTGVFTRTFVSGSVKIFGATLLYDQFIAFGVSWIAIGILWYYVTRTDSGRSIRATAMSERGAQLTGVDIGAVNTRTWLIAGTLAGIAGLFLTSLQSASPNMWLSALALAFIIVVVGGIGSIKGSVVAAYMIGFLETGAVRLISEDARGIFALLLLLIVLLAMPQGLFGREFIHE